MQRSTQSTNFPIDGKGIIPRLSDSIIASSKGATEKIVVNCSQIPETICVETRFITSATAMQKRSDQVFYMTTKNGQLELTRKEEHVSSVKHQKFSSNKPTVTLSIRQKTGQSVTTTSVATGAVKFTNSPAATTVIPLSTAFSNYGNNSMGVMTNIPPKSTMPIPTVSIPISNNNHLQNYKMPMFPSKAVVTMDAACMTDPKPIFQNKLQQTDDSKPLSVSVAIQCQINEEYEYIFDWPTTVEEPQIDSPDLDDQKEEFIQYVKENSIQYKNNLRECLICGEISKKPKYFYGHMAIHRGPNILCFKCGQYLEHEALLKNHFCKQSKQMESTFLRCPHYSCGILAISRLELYDHINEHNNYRMHMCSVCHKDFCTTQEFLRHLLLRAKCYTGAKRKRFSLYGLVSHKDRVCRVRVFTLHTEKRRTTLVKTFLSQRKTTQSYCKICLKRYRNKFVLNRHFNKCLALFRKRLMRKEQRRKAKL